MEKSLLLWTGEKTERLNRLPFSQPVKNILTKRMAIDNHERSA